MKLKSILFLALTIGVVDTLLYSCCADEDPLIVGTFQFCTVTAENFDNSGATAVPVSDTAEAAAFAIRLAVEMTENDVCSVHTPFLLNGAYACTNQEQVPLYVVRERIVDVRIITQNDFSSAYLAGSDISSLFYVFTGNEYRALLRQFQVTEVEEIAPRRATALLLGDFDFEGMHQFTVEVELADGSVITTTTQPIYLR